MNTGIVRDLEDEKMVKQDRKTGVGGSDYVVHLDRPGYPAVWCGRKASAVNRTDDDTEREELCKMCLRCRALAQAVTPREVKSATGS